MFTALVPPIGALQLLQAPLVVQFAAALANGLVALAAR
jgi:hypothetical protein